MILILLLMLFLGPVQVLSAILQLAFTKNAHTRQHLSYYLIGVLLYFIVLIPMWDNMWKFMESPLSAIHFFGGAAALAIYHIVIVWKSLPKNLVEFTGVDMNGNPS